MELSSIIEAILFTSGEPTSLEVIAKITQKEPQDVLAALEVLRDSLAGRGLLLLEHGTAFQLGTHPACHEYTERLRKNEFSQDLSRSSLETLAIIAYKGPMTRAAIEHVRGVNASFALRNLLMRGLVERREHPSDARTYLYQASFDFLKYFGITSLAELPAYGELNAKSIEITDAKEQSESINPSTAT